MARRIINGSGAINRHNGDYTCTITESATGVYVVSFDTALLSNQYGGLATLLCSTHALVSYNNQTTTGVSICTYNSDGTATDIGISCAVTTS